MTGMEIDSTQIRRVGAPLPPIDRDAEGDPLDELAGLLDSLSGVDPADSAEPASRIAEILGDALDEEDR